VYKVVPPQQHSLLFAPLQQERITESFHFITLLENINQGNPNYSKISSASGEAST
jgi:hypothetical protein